MNDELTSVDGVSRRTVLKTGAAGTGVVALSGAATADDHGTATDTRKEENEVSEEIITQTADVLGQDPDREVVAEDGAALYRTDDALVTELTMPTPVPGEYTYASEPPEREGEWWTDEPGELEAFTLWVLTFNEPEECEGGVGECGGDDLGEPAGGGGFGVDGAIPTGDQLTMNGVVTTETEVFENGDPIGVSLERPLEAEVHVAVAPHGAFDPNMMPEILETPVSPPDVWWTAFFDPPA
ncbi:hypothetical protein C482_07586 [Natrialba chahannaoensis JCM 10990]|uniref:Uncharacterized protein n=1 Tax=Natrialba chahannaoensis JCM 10990 TaxID=1227492 RepID=M0AUK8_9EURY|nr:hypothetical protein C482_07586 [Natrialba chahannaoensis JCM 10990]